MTIEEFCERLTDILENYNANVRALIEEIRETSPASTAPSARPLWLETLYRQADASAPLDEREL